MNLTRLLPVTAATRKTSQISCNHCNEHLVLHGSLDNHADLVSAPPERGASMHSGSHVVTCNSGNEKIICTKENVKTRGSVRLIISAFLVQSYFAKRDIFFSAAEHYYFISDSLW